MRVGLSQRFSKRPCAGGPGRRRPLAAWAACGLAVAITAVSSAAGQPAQQPPGGDEIPLVVGRSVVLDHPDAIQRVAITNDNIADAIAISTREILLNAKTPGVTTLVIWSRSGDRNFFNVAVSPDATQFRQHLRDSFPGEAVEVEASRGVLTLSGKVSGPEVAERMVAMAAGAGLGTVVNNLALPPPPTDRQIILKVRFAEVQRAALQEFGVNILSTGALNTPGVIGTQQFGGLSVNEIQGTIGAPTVGASTEFTLTDILNVFAFRPDLNLGAVIKALRTKNLIETLAEPNIITSSGKEAEFLVGGEFPVPVVQGGATAGAVTIQFREFGIRLGFLPELTERGTIKMHVVPEVSALDFANAVQLAGFTVPALSTRRVETDVELLPGQSFVIGGLIDNRLQDTVSRIPGLSKIPVLGELFKSRSKERTNTELLVLVTPSFPQPIEPGAELPELPMGTDFMEPLSQEKDNMDWLRE